MHSLKRLYDAEPIEHSSIPLQPEVGPRRKQKLSSSTKSFLRKLQKQYTFFRSRKDFAEKWSAFILLVQTVLQKDSFTFDDTQLETFERIEREVFYTLAHLEWAAVVQQLLQEGDLLRAEVVLETMVGEELNHQLVDVTTDLKAELEKEKERRQREQEERLQRNVSGVIHETTRTLSFIQLIDLVSRKILRFTNSTTRLIVLAQTAYFQPNYFRERFVSFEKSVQNLRAAAGAYPTFLETFQQVRFEFEQYPMKIQELQVELDRLKEVTEQLRENRALYIQHFEEETLPRIRKTMEQIIPSESYFNRFPKGLLSNEDFAKFQSEMRSMEKKMVAGEWEEVQGLFRKQLAFIFGISEEVEIPDNVWHHLQSVETRLNQHSLTETSETEQLFHVKRPGEEWFHGSTVLNDPYFGGTKDSFKLPKRYTLSDPPNLRLSEEEWLEMQRFYPETYFYKGNPRSLPSSVLEEYYRLLQLRSAEDPKQAQAITDFVVKGLRAKQIEPSGKLWVALADETKGHVPYPLFHSKKLVFNVNAAPDGEEIIARMKLQPTELTSRNYLALNEWEVNHSYSVLQGRIEEETLDNWDKFGIEAIEWLQDPILKEKRTLYQVRTAIRDYRTLQSHVEGVIGSDLLKEDLPYLRYAKEHPEEWKTIAKETSGFDIRTFLYNADYHFVESFAEVHQAQLAEKEAQALLEAKIAEENRIRMEGQQVLEAAGEASSRILERVAPIPSTVASVASSLLPPSTSEAVVSRLPEGVQQTLQRLGRSITTVGEHVAQVAERMAASPLGKFVLAAGKVGGKILDVLNPVFDVMTVIDSFHFALQLRKMNQAQGILHSPLESTLTASPTEKETLNASQGRYLDVIDEIRTFFGGS